MKTNKINYSATFSRDDTPHYYFATHPPKRKKRVAQIAKQGSFYKMHTNNLVFIF